MNEVMVGTLNEFADGDYRVLRVDTFEVGIFRQGERLMAYENYCPHDGGPVCQGKVIPRVEEELAADQTSRGLKFSSKKNIVCPWHGWEFDIESGRHCGDPKYRLRPVDVRVRDNQVYVSLPAEA
jgi:nitrite reductase/ring-hydroxylating ferredoxin subunit